jgi:hypothetical protein
MKERCWNWLEVSSVSQILSFMRQQPAILTNGKPWSAKSADTFLFHLNYEVHLLFLGKYLWLKPMKPKQQVTSWLQQLISAVVPVTS